MSGSTALLAAAGVLDRATFTPGVLMVGIGTGCGGQTTDVTACSPHRDYAKMGVGRLPEQQQEQQQQDAACSRRGEHKGGESQWSRADQSF